MAKVKEADMHKYRRQMLKNVLSVTKTAEDLYKRQAELEPDVFDGLYGEKRLITPYYAFDNLYLIYEESDILQACIEAMQQNVDGFGHKLQFLGDDTKKESPEATKQKGIALDFFDQINEEQSFATARKAIREDLEVLGNAAFEMIRNRRGELTLMYPAPFKNIRVSALVGNPVSLPVKLKRGGKEVTVKVRKYFRKYVQISENGRRLRWFKEFGDPRIMDAMTGDFDNTARVKASELWHLKLSFGGKAYGLPRWIGAVLQVLGRRAASFVNYDLFESQGIPPMAIMVSGGTLTDESVEELEDMVRSLRGVGRWNRVMLLESNTESLGMEEKGNARLELKNLSEYRKEDMMFDKYLVGTEKDVRHRFRFPPLYVGGAETFTHACYDTLTETLTHRGWVTIDEYLDGDLIATLNPADGRLEYHVPEEVHIYPAPRTMVAFESRGTDACVTGNHDMWSQKYIKSMPEWEKIHAEDVYNGKTGRFLWKVAPDRLEVGEVPVGLPIEDYELLMDFIGSVAADGSIDRGGSRIRFNVKKERKKERYGALMKEMAEVVGCPFVRRPGTRDGYEDIEIRHDGLHQFCSENLLAPDRQKKLPDWVWCLEESLSSILLDSLVFADGCAIGRGPNSQVYVSTSKLLADQVQALAFRLGKRTRIVPVSGEERGRKTTYYVHMTNTTTQMVEKKNIKVVDSPTDRVYCFHVENHLFVTRRNGCISIHGNTARAAQTVAEEQVFIPERMDFDEPVNLHIMKREFGLDMWKFVSKGPRIVGSQEISTGVETFSKVGAFSVNHCIEQANEAFGMEMSKFTEEWADYPVPFVVELLKLGKLKGLENLTIPTPTPPEPPKQLTAPKQLMLPKVTEKMFKSDVFSDNEKSLYQLLITMQTLLEGVNKCETDMEL